MNQFAVFFRKYGHKVLTFSIGLVFLGLCVFGAVMGVRHVYHMFRPENIYEEGVDPDLIAAGSAFDELRDSGLEPASKEFFTQYISNFIAQDFPDFKSPVVMKNTDHLVSYGLWQAIKVNGQGVYSFRNNDEFLVPEADVEKYALYNFDFAGELEHRTVDVCGEFTYDSWSDCYTVSTDVMDAEYLVPSILDIEKNEESGHYTLIVDCYYSDPQTQTDVTQDVTRLAKRVELVLRPIEMAVGDGEDAAETTVTDYQFFSCKRIDETEPLKSE